MRTHTRFSSIVAHAVFSILFGTLMFSLLFEVNDSQAQRNSLFVSGQNSSLASTASAIPWQKIELTSNNWFFVAPGKLNEYQQASVVFTFDGVVSIL